MMRTLRSLLSLAVVATALAYAQSAAPAPKRVVVLPFNASSSTSSFQLGLPTALQRSLNEVPGLYAPPVGDVALVMQKAQQAGRDPVATVRQLFEADVVVEGAVDGTGSTLRATLTLSVGSQQQSLSVQAPDGTPATLARAAAKAVATALEPDLGAAALTRIDTAAAQTPSLPSLGPVALAASRLPGAKVDDLASAAQLDPQSSWVKAEYARLLALNGDTKTAVSVAQQAVQAQPDDVEAQVVLGIVLQADKQSQAALDAYRKALAINPNDAIALTGAAGLESDATKATAELQAAVRSYPRMLEAHLKLAALQSDPQRALQTLRNAEGALPESLSLHQAIVQQVLKIGDDKGALAYLQQAVQDPMAVSPGLYALARLLPADVTDGALALVKAGQKAYPDAGVLKAAEGELLVRKGDYVGAEGVLAPLHTAYPKDNGIANLLTVAQARQGKLDAARQTFESVNGNGTAAQAALAQIYLAAGRAEAALKLLEPIVQQGTQDATTVATYGLALGRIGKLDQAKSELEKALKLQPSLALAQRGLGLLKQQQQLTGGTQITFTADAGAAFQQGIYALEVQDYQAAARAFAQARKLDDNGLSAFFEGYAVQLTGDPRSAVEAYQAALKAFPKSDIVLNNLGYAHLQLGRFDLAVPQLEQALQINPDNAQAHLNLGLTYYGLGRYQDAISQFDTAVKLDPNLSTTVAGVRKQAEQKAAGQ